MIETRFTRLIGIERPIVQGGLQSLAYAGLAAAVSNAGGLGQITVASFPARAALREEIRLCKSLTAKPFSLNFALGMRPLNDLLDLALEEGVKCVSFTAGNPEAMIRQIQNSGLENDVKILVLVAGVRAAQKAESLGAHTVIAVGYEGGGHLGRDDIGSLVLVPKILDSVKIPVLASGGIGDARGYAAALALGAEGIEMGTRFVATQECLAHANYKQALVNAKETDTVIIERSIGKPARVLQGEWAAKVAAVEAAIPPPTIEELLPLIAGERNRRAALEGKFDEGFVWAGQVSGLIHDIPTVRELLDRLTSGAEEIITGLAAKLRS